MSLVQIGQLEVELNRKPIKNLHVSVLPPEGKVRVAAPLRLSDVAIRTAVIQRIPWIRKQQQAFAAQPREAERRLVSGESHYVWGRRYRLEVIEQLGRQQVERAGAGRLRLYAHPGVDADMKRRQLAAWYRRELKARVAQLIEPWQRKLGVNPSFWGIKQMKTKWGSCNPSAGRIWLNLELAKKPVECLEFVLVHELVHLLERHHNDRFLALMDKHLPQWRASRARLNDAPLAFADWDCRQSKKTGIKSDS